MVHHQILGQTKKSRYPRTCYTRVFGYAIAAPLLNSYGYLNKRHTMGNDQYNLGTMNWTLAVTYSAQHYVFVTGRKNQPIKTLKFHNDTHFLYFTRPYFMVSYQESEKVRATIVYLKSDVRSTERCGGYKPYRPSLISSYFVFLHCPLSSDNTVTRLTRLIH